MQYDWLVWRRYLVEGTDAKAISTLEEQDALGRPASPTTSAPMADVKVLARRFLSNTAMADDEEDWTTGNLIEVNAGDRVYVKRRLNNMEEVCRAKSRKIQESVCEAVGLVLELVDDSSGNVAGAVGVANNCIDQVTGQLASTKAEVIILTTKLYDLDYARDKKKL